jgi:hypothetical protein
MLAALLAGGLVMRRASRAIVRRRTWQHCLCASIGLSVLAAPGGSAALGQVPRPRALSTVTTTSVMGIVGDSLHGGPLAGAVVMVDGQAREAVTDSIGRFRIDGITAGSYRVGIFHPILDSMGTSLASTPVAFHAGKPLLITLATPSGRTLRHAICPEVPPRHPRYEHADSGVAVVVGRVLDPESDDAVTDATVTLSWIETAFNAARVNVTPYRRVTTTDGTGDFKFCALPSGLTGTLRAISARTQTQVERELSLDNRIVTMATVHLAAGESPAAANKGHAVLIGEIDRPDGSPLPGATAIVEGTPDSAITGHDGTFTMRGLPDGTHMLVVRSIGYEPISDVVELTNKEAQRISIALTTPAHVLSPVLVEAQQLQVAYKRIGFDRRQREGVGQFMTASTIEDKHAQFFSQLFSNVGGVSLAYVPGGTNLASARGPGGCLVYMLDGQPFNRIVNGELDMMFRPDEIAAIEVYSAASVPVEFRVRSLPGLSAAGVPTLGSDGCETVVVWTKTHLGVTGDASSSGG